MTAAEMGAAEMGQTGLLARLRNVSREQLLALGIAQFLSFLLCITGITSGVLAGKNINAPATQAFSNYAAIAVTCGFLHYWERGWKWQVVNAWYVYVVLAFLDVQGNFLVTKAYQYTSITSVTLLDCFTIPAVMVLSWVIFRARYTPLHLSGAALCVLGLSVLVVTDRDSETGGRNPLLGDALVIMGACVYAACNVAQERLLVTTSRWEMLAMLGCWGTVFSGAQALVLERSAWSSAEWDGAALAALLGFGGALYCFYVLVPLVLQWGGSTVLNLSLLTSDLWAAAARAVMFGGFGGTGVYFAIAMVAEAAGIALYTASGDTHSHKAQCSAQHEGAAEASMDSNEEETGPLLGGLEAERRSHTEQPASQLAARSHTSPQRASLGRVSVDHRALLIESPVSVQLSRHSGTSSHDYG